jgi:hypothetical protein
MKTKATKRGPYQRRFHQPLFGNGLKTTTKEGRNSYMKEYMQALRELKKEKK